MFWGHLWDVTLVGELGSILKTATAPAVASVQLIHYKNAVLDALSADAVRRLELHPVVFEVGHEMEYPGRHIAHMFFIEAGMASMTATFVDGSQVEVGTFGYESVIGLSAVMGTKRSLNRVYTQIEGRGYSSPMVAAQREFDRCGEFQRIALRYVQTQLVQAMQSAGCNAKHNFEQRLARWLLICADRAHSNTFRMSQQFLADMLGGTRPTISSTAVILKDSKLIEYHRGVVHILDVEGLEKTACECYHVIKDHLNNYAEFDSGTTE